MTPGDAMHGNDDEPTPNGAHTVRGGNVGRKLQELEAEDIALRAYVDEKVDEVKDEIAASEGRLGGKLDQLVAAHNASPIKRTFDVVEKMASPTTGVALLLNMLVVLLWLTGLDFDGAGYKIGAAGAVKAQANEDSDDGGSAAGVAPDPAP